MLKFLFCAMNGLCIDNEVPNFDASKEIKPKIHEGVQVVMAFGLFTIFCAVMTHQVLHLPAMLGMMFGL